MADGINVKISELFAGLPCRPLPSCSVCRSAPMGAYTACRIPCECSIRVFNGDASHPSEKTHFGCLYPQPGGNLILLQSLHDHTCKSGDEDCSVDQGLYFLPQLLFRHNSTVQTLQYRPCRSDSPADLLPHPVRETTCIARS